MEIEVSQEKLAKALNNVSRIATGKVTLPVLNNVLIRVEDKKVSLITTNLDMAVIDYLPVSDMWKQRQLLLCLYLCLSPE